MTQNPFFSARDILEASEHLGRPGSSVIFTMHSGEVRTLIDMEAPSVHGRVAGTTDAGFPIVFDAARVESFTFAVDRETIEDASDDLLSLAVRKEEALSALLDAIKVKDEAAIEDAVIAINRAEQDMRVLTGVAQASQMAQDRPGEFGGYAGSHPGQNGAGEAAIEPPTVLNERSVQELIAEREDTGEVVSLDEPRRRGRPPKAR